jgi:HEAT repeat protein
MSRKNWTSEKIFTRLLNNKTQKTFWGNVSELTKRPNKVVYNQAFKLANSEIDKEKIIGIYVLAQLGFDPRFQQNKTVDLYFKLLEKEKSIKVISAILSSISHNNEHFNDNQISKLIEYKTHKSTDVRFELTLAISCLNNKTAIDTLIELSMDKDSDIRNWATFGLGTQLENDNEEIRSALWNRVNDSDFETKSEAIVGLTKRMDKRIKEVIISELKNGNYGALLFEAILKLNDKEFLAYLNNNLKIAKKDKDDIKNGWVLALEETIKELKKLRSQNNVYKK